MHDSSYVNGTNCSLLKIGFSVTHLDLELKWSSPRNITKGCIKNYRKRIVGLAREGFLLDVGEGKHHPLFHKSVPLPEATKASGSR